MKVSVDPLKCDTSGICVMECPDVFRFREGSKKAMVVFDTIPQQYQAKCIEVARLCPTGAIVISK